MRAQTWRWLALLFAGGTLVGGLIGAMLGFSHWPATIGAVATTALGEVYRLQLARARRRLDVRPDHERKP